MQAHPEDPRGPFWQGFYATQKKPADLVEAEQGYRDALKREPKFLPASLSLAALLQQSNRAEESLKILREAEEAGAPASVLQMAWGAALVIAKEPAKAEAVYRKILETDPLSVTAVQGVAAALIAQKNPAEAKRFLEDVLKTHPELPSLRERLAEISLGLGEKAEALARYQEEIQAGRATVALRLKAARLALDLGKLDLALSESRKALEEQARSSEATYLIGRVHEARGEKSQALAEFRRAVGWDPLPEYALAYGQMLMKLGKEQEAMVFLSKAESIPQARLERGRLFFRKGEVDKANEDFLAAAEGLPNQVEPFLLQAMCFDKLGQKDKAERAWRSALKINPDEPESHYRLGRQEMDRGKPAVALDHLRKAANKLQDKASWESDLVFQLGQAELLSGSKSAALAAFQKYLEVAPDDAPARPEAMDQVKRLSPKK
jgi:tetratricopeptide (TPR) repeat protein